MVNASPGTSDTPAGGSPSTAHRPPSAAASTDGDAPDAQPQAVATWDGFQAFATTPAAAPPPPGTPHRSLEERLAYHSRFVTVRTPAIDALAKNVRTLMILGRHQAVTARPSLIVTGPAGAGKTTALLQVGRACHLAHTRRHGAAATAGQAPVAYVLVPPAASAKTLAIEFARYLGIPVTAGMSQAQITGAVCHTYTAARVQLVMIDEIHRLNPRTTTGAQSADLIKDLTERIGATFVYAGIDVTTTPLFTGVRGAQLAGRASSSTAPPSPPASATKSPSATSSPRWKARSTCATTGPEPSPGSPPTCTSAPPAASAASPASSAKPRSPRYSTAPSASPKPPSTPSASTTSPNSTTNPAPGPGAGIPAPREPDRRHSPYCGRSRPRPARRPHHRGMAADPVSRSGRAPCTATAL